VRCAAAVRDAVRDLGLRVRCGLHAGEVQRGGEGIGGIGVHIASRVLALAGADEVLVYGRSGTWLPDRASSSLRPPDGVGRGAGIPFRSVAQPARSEAGGGRFSPGRGAGRPRGALRVGISSVGEPGRRRTGIDPLRLRRRRAVFGGRSPVRQREPGPR
jgi:hypothetical protein